MNEIANSAHQALARTQPGQYATVSHAQIGGCTAQRSLRPAQSVIASIVFRRRSCQSGDDAIGPCTLVLSKRAKT
jgi:hypothetical protein